MEYLEFSTLLQKNRSSGFVGFILPFDISGKYGEQSIVKVCGTIDLFPFDNCLLPVGERRHGMKVNREIRKVIGKDEGDNVFVQIKTNDRKKKLIIPDKFQYALDNNIDAKNRFESLTELQKMEILEWIYGINQSEIKDLRILKIINRLKNIK